MIYNALILSKINYGILTWGYESESILKLQKKAVRIITSAKYNAHTEPIFKKLSILNIHDLFSLCQLKFYHNYLNKLLPHHFINMYFKMNNEVHHYSTRISTKLHVSKVAALSVGHTICRLHPLQRGKTPPPPMGPPVGRGWIPVRSEDGILVVECSGSQGLSLPMYNTPLWPLLGPKTGGWKWPVPINRLVKTCPKSHTFLQTYCSYINC